MDSAGCGSLPESVGTTHRTGTGLGDQRCGRPREYQQAVESGELENLLMAPPVPLAVKLWKRLGFVALAVGLLLIALIIYAQLIAYR